jgi:putative transposase
MNKLFSAVGISKQSFHQKMDRLHKVRSEQQQLLLLIYQIRQDHPTMGVRDMYFKLNPPNTGRDAFESLCAVHGIMLKRTKNWRRTTDSSGVIRFDNLIKDIQLTQMNQVWQSDITYYEVKNRFYYITFIIDSYTRRLIGHSTSKSLATEFTTLPALKMAIATRKKENQSISHVILHSDGGGQYYAKEFLRLTQKEKISNSMCEFAWENGKAERLNGVIKNNYLKHRTINNFNELVKEVDRSVLLYNFEKPHIELQRKTPIEYEKHYICNGQRSDDDKSATELKTQLQGAFSALRAEDNNPSESNIAQELKFSRSNKYENKVNVI